MANNSILTSSRLINSIKRRAFIPSSQETFSNEDFLEMATEEINISLMSQIMEARGDYLVYYIDVPMVENQLEYPIPARAQGNKLRDVSIIENPDNAQIIYEMSQVSIDELSDYQGAYSSLNSRTYFYMQNNNVVLPINTIMPQYYLRMWFYMRPNALVMNNRAGTIVSVEADEEINNIDAQSGSITNIAIGTTTVITSVGHGLSGGELVNFSATNSTPVIDGFHTITYIDANTFSISFTTTVSGNAGDWDLAMEVAVITLDVVPSHFTSDLYYDIVGNKSPNKIVRYDLVPNELSVQFKTISFPLEEFTVSDEIIDIVGDYLTQAEETIVPNVPTEYHPVIAQRVACACLEAMGDNENLTKANSKLEKMEANVLKMVVNRVEGAPKKIKQRFGTLNETSMGVYGRRWKRL